MMDNRPLLEVIDLHVTFATDVGFITAVDGISFSITAGERVGLAGESGSGKSVTALSIMGLLRSPSATIEGQVRLLGDDLLGLPERRMRHVRGRRVAMVFQNPLHSLNPAMTIGDQIVESITAHERMPRNQARGRAIELLGRVGIPSPARSADEYPHRFSGGMRQRVMIAMALSCGPDLVIADEPTTALDVTIQSQILDLLASVCDEVGTAVLLITHDLGILARFADRIAVMYAGKLMEEGSVDKLFYGATHPYTWGLMSSLTRLDEPRRSRLSAIEGNPPSPVVVASGCRFHPRCPYCEEVCIREIPELEVRPADDHPCACHFAGQLSPAQTRADRTGSQ